MKYLSIGSMTLPLDLDREEVRQAIIELAAWVSLAPANTTVGDTADDGSSAVRTVASMATIVDSLGGLTCSTRSKRASCAPRRLSKCSRRPSAPNQIARFTPRVGSIERAPPSWVAKARPIAWGRASLFSGLLPPSPRTLAAEVFSIPRNALRDLNRVERWPAPVLCLGARRKAAVRPSLRLEIKTPAQIELDGRSNLRGGRRPSRAARHGNPKLCYTRSKPQ